MKSLYSLLSRLFDDVKRLMPEVQGLDRDLITIKHRVEHEGDSFLAITFPTICDALDRGLADSRFTCPTAFSKVRGGALPKLLSGLLCKVFDVDGSLREHPSEEAIKILRELTRFFKKIDLSDEQAAMLDASAKERFIEDDASCITSLATVDDRMLYIVDQVSRQVLLKLDDFRPDELLCKHGPGAVAEGISSNQKWAALCNHSELLEAHGLDCLYISMQASYTGGYSFGVGTGGLSTCRLVSVPKSTTARRTITIEPVEFQYVQQGYNTHLRSHIGKCDILSKCLTLDDQTANRQLAESGSITGDWATLDLKSASDLLSLALVKRVLSSRPVTLEGLISCRSNVCDTGVKHTPHITLNKYAGMGNATTFPIQSIVFAILALCACVDDGSRITRNKIRRAATSVRVYGDDIIVRSSCAERTIKWIEAFGLRVNSQKSFWTGRFRESCGLDAYNGVDVTPLYLRCDPRSDQSANALASFVSTSNQLWDRGLYETAAYLAAHVESVLRRKLPLVRKDSPALGWHTRYDVTTISKWNRRLHRFEFPGLLIQPMYRKDKLNGWPALLKFFHTSSSNGQLELPIGDVKHLERSPKRFLTRLVSRRTPS